LPAKGISSDVSWRAKLPKVSGELILVVEDEADLAEVIVAYLRRDGFRAVVIGNGTRALDGAISLAPHLILLDVNLPGLDGFEVLRRLRQTQPPTCDLPVVMVTARVDEVDRVSGFRLGADDYVVKPFSPSELVERVKAVLRRTSPSVDQDLRYGPLLIEPLATRLSVDGVVIECTSSELKLLTHLARSSGQTFSRLQLLEAVLPESEAGERVIDAHLGNLRKRLNAAGLPDPITTVRGFGYRFDESLLTTPNAP
jgi:two-component system, OmpR family, response regulator AdeR